MHNMLNAVSITSQNIINFIIKKVSCIIFALKLYYWEQLAKHLMKKKFYLIILTNLASKILVMWQTLY